MLQLVRVERSIRELERGEQRAVGAEVSVAGQMRDRRAVERLHGRIHGRLPAGQA